jgi:hypothetical protein
MPRTEQGSLARLTTAAGTGILKVYDSVVAYKMSSHGHEPVMLYQEPVCCR